ncbi:hypothetical protein TWF506_004563 [Arthrobotrys conoides]|uniref:Uncharacterized protein n=1 Tax=Arthrobotrys conoides TaxID=74498 RepID=A0AAN8NAV9_9PEZI
MDSIHAIHGVHILFIASWPRGCTYACTRLQLLRRRPVIAVDINSKMILLLLAPLFGTIASAFYVEVVPVGFPNLDPWQLCHSTRQAQEKYELTLWAIDIASTSCEATHGDPHFQLLEGVDPDPMKYALGKDESKTWEAYASEGLEIGNRALIKPMVTTERDLNVALNYKDVDEVEGLDIVALFELRRYGSEVIDEPVVGDILKFVGGSDDLLSQDELGLQIDLVQTDAGDTQAGKQNAGRKSIFRSESSPSPDAKYPQVLFRISSPLRIYELTREIAEAKKKPKRGFAPKKALGNFFGGIKKSISNKVSNAKESVKGTLKSGFEKGLASVTGGPRMRLHGLDEDDKFEEEKEQDLGREENLRDQTDWEDQFGNDQDEGWESRLARFYGTGSDTGNARVPDEEKIKIVEDRWEDMEEGGGYFGEEGAIEPGVIQDNYIDIKVEEKPKSMEVFEVEQGKPSSQSGSKNQV